MSTDPVADAAPAAPSETPTTPETATPEAAAPAAPDAVVMEQPETTPGLPLELLANLRPRFIMEPRQRVDQDGRQITEMIVLVGAPPADVVRFIAHGQAQIKVMVADPKGGPAKPHLQNIPINTVLKDARDLDHAFVMYDDAIQAAGKAHVEQLKSNHVRAQLAAGFSGR